MEVEVVEAVERPVALVTDVKSIWQAWDEGAYIKDVGRKLALRLIDTKWGNLKSQETHKRKFPSWRPRNDNKVCAHP